MVPQESALMQMLVLVDEMPLPAPSHARRGRGRGITCPTRLFVKAALIMVAKRLPRVHELLQTLSEPTDEMLRLRKALLDKGKMPSRRTFEQRLTQLASLLPEIIARLGALLTRALYPFAATGRAAAVDSTLLRAKDGAVWHKKHRDSGQVPHTRIDTQAGWSNSGWHGWVYGWKLHVACTVSGATWIPLAARLTPADVYDGQVGPQLVAQLPAEIRFVLGDQHYNGVEMQAACFGRGMELVASRGRAQGSYPHSDIGVEVRRLFHQLRSKAIENFNEHFKAIFDSHADVPTKGEVATARFVLTAVLVYQLGLWARHRLGLTTLPGVEALLESCLIYDQASSNRLSQHGF